MQLAHLAVVKLQDGSGQAIEQIIEKYRPQRLALQAQRMPAARLSLRMPARNGAGTNVAAMTSKVQGLRRRLTLVVDNAGDRPIQVGSHYHFAETNGALRFDRAAARGMRLDIASGTAVRFEPGQQRTVQLVELAGARTVFGFRGLVQGPL